MKPILNTIVVTIMASTGLGGYTMTVGKETSVADHARIIFAKAKNFTQTQISKIDLDFDVDWNQTEPEYIKETYEPVLQASLDSMFFKKNGYFFSQSKWGAQSVPYQFQGLELIGPKTLTTNGADEARGIKARLGFSFYVKAYRTYDRTDGWGSWNVDTPPNLDNIVLVLHENTWKVASSPHQSFNLK